MLPPERIWILTNDHLRAEIVRQLPEVPKRQILAEPAQRNTAPAIGLAAHILQSIDPDAVMGVFPADHVIGKPRDYVRLLRPAFRAASEGKIVVLGIQPRWAETGYGYIEFPRGVKAASRARSGGRGQQFSREAGRGDGGAISGGGNFYWNAGMFFWRASVLLDALARVSAEDRDAAGIDLPAFRQPRSSRRKLAKAFPLCENISIDYAVLEQATNVAGIPAGDIGWNDVGSWNAVYELQKRDANGNACRADMLTTLSRGELRAIMSMREKKLVALLGVKDLIIVDTPDALLIADRSRAQQVGEIVKRLEKSGREDLL